MVFDILIISTFGLCDIVSLGFIFTSFVSVLSCICWCSLHLLSDLTYEIRYLTYKEGGWALAHSSNSVNISYYSYSHILYSGKLFRIFLSVNDFQVCISRLILSSELQPAIFNCFLNVVTWYFFRHLKLSKTRNKFESIHKSPFCECLFIPPSHPNLKHGKDSN